MACRNSKDGMHYAGPPDCFGHSFCVRCGFPLVRLQEEKSYDAFPYAILSMMILLIAAIAYVIYYGREAW